MRWSVLSAARYGSPPPAFCLRAPAAGQASGEAGGDGADLLQRDRRLGRTTSTLKRSPPSPLLPQAGGRADVKIATDGGEKTVTSRPNGSASAMPAPRSRLATIGAPACSSRRISGRRGPGAGQVHRLLRARDARQQGAVAPVHRAGLRKPPDLTDKPYYTRAEIEQEP